VLGDVGWGWFRWADAIVGALDNREARLLINRAGAMLGRAWIDGGIEVLNGIVRRFAPPQTACYECTMGAKDWEEVDQRRSCSLLARTAAAAGGTPTTPTTASVIGAIQAQEVVKQLHGLEMLSGSGYVFEGLMHSSYGVRYSVNPDCPWHEDPAPLETADEFGLGTTWNTIWDFAAARLGGLDAIDLARELVSSLRCSQCGWARSVLKPISRITAADAVCAECGTECVADFVHSVAANSDWLEKTVGQSGLPAWDVVWARRGEEVLGIELAADRLVAEAGG
jgi:adenylyltransferase/sulfurtransferase